MAKKPNAATTAEDQKKTAAADDKASGPAPDANAQAVTGDTAAGAGAEGTAAVADTPAVAAAGAEGAAVEQQTTPVVEAAAPAKPDAEPPPERRGATVASRIEHDGEDYAPDDLILLTETEFRGLARSGALVETRWEDCTAED